MVGTLVMGWAACSSEFRIAEEPPPREQTDVFDQQDAPLSDVLFVVDNSESMEDEQELLATNFPAFVDWFERSDVDYHIGVISTDMDDNEQSGLLRESQGAFWIERSTPNAAEVFADMTRLGITGSTEERGREAAYTALELRGAANAGFRRDDAFLNVVVVSDEDDQSGDDRVSRLEFTAYLQDLQTETVRTTFSAIVGPGSFLEAQACDVAPGFEYLEVVRAVGGIAWSICDEDWSPLLDELGFVSVGLRKTFLLNYTPLPDSLTVGLDDGTGEVELSAAAWAYDELANAVTFLDQPPPRETRVIVRYLTADEA